MKQLLIFLVLVFTACSTTSKENTDSLVIVTSVEPVSLDPNHINTISSFQVARQVFDRLIERNENGEFVPGLATSWKYISPTNFELTLREGVLFHDGTPFTSKDAVYTLNRIRTSSFGSNLFNPVKEVRADGDYKISILLSEPLAPLIANLALELSSIGSADYLEKSKNAGQNFVNVPLGTGPFSFVSWERGQSVQLASNPNYWDGEPEIKSVEFRVIPEASARTIALETGEADIAYYFDPIDRERLADNSKLTYLEKPMDRVEFINVNFEKQTNPILKDPRVRRAVALSLDAPGIISSVLFNAAIPAGSYIPKSVFGHDDTLPPLKQNIEEARRLIKEAGAEGVEVRLLTSAGKWQRVMEVVQANLIEIGLNAKIDVLEWARYIEDTGLGKHQIMILGWTMASGDPDFGFYNVFHSAALGNAGNRGFYVNPKLDQLLDAARRELDPKKRSAYLKEIEKINRDDLAYVPLYYPLEIVGLKKSVKGFGFKTSATHILKNVYKE